MQKTGSRKRAGFVFMPRHSVATATRGMLRRTGRAAALSAARRLVFNYAHDPRVDFNSDGVIDFGDYLEFLNFV